MITDASKSSISCLDAHTHLDSDELYSQKAEALRRAEEAGVVEMLLVNSEATAESFQRTIECKTMPGASKRHCAFGIHPHHASSYSQTLEDLLIANLKSSGAIALGEIGLDFYYDFSPRDRQIEVLKRQLQLSLELNLPVVIHCRDAYEQLAEILRSIKSVWRGMIHCFTGNSLEAQSLLNLGFHISFSGIVTFKNATILCEAAKTVPADRFLVETDAPYLAPVPVRGKTNEPAFVVHTAKFLAALRGTSLEEFSSQLFHNFSACFF
jgi:TatD DNase family protein